MLSSLAEPALHILVVALSGLAFAAFDRQNFNLKWFAAALGLMALWSVIYELTGRHGILPNLFEGARWNWQDKIIAFAVFLGIAALPAFGWKEVGWTFKHKPGSLRAVAPLTLIYAGLFIVLALMEPPTNGTAETVAFQLTMPSLEEELVFRGVLLFAFYKAFEGRWRLFNVGWSWGAIPSCVAFGLVHAMQLNEGAIRFEWLYFLATAVPSLGAVWLRLRTGSLLIPILLHSVGNAASHLI